MSYPTLTGKLWKSPSFTGLVVKTERFVDLNLGDPYEGRQARPTPYTLYNQKGQRLQYVRNYIGSRDTEPTRVSLDPGKYLVLLEKPGNRSPVFWVNVQEDRLTEVDVSALPETHPNP